MPNDNIFATGLTLDFYESADFEKESGKNTKEDHLIKARNLLRVLMMGWNPNWRTLNSWQTFFAIFSKRDHDLTLALRRAFQHGFQHVFEQLKGSTLNEQQHQQALLFISNCMAFLPFADMTPHEFISIPQYVDNAWRLIEYKVVPIELTPTSGFQKLFLADHDRVFAYGLEPISQLKAEPHLIFMGTTYPAGQGFATTVETDLEAFETAGKKLYRTGHKNITKWLQKQTNKVHVCGTSLGGALSLLVAIDQGNKLSRVDALNPPGLYSPWRKSRFDHWDELTEKPVVFVQKQGSDPVSRFGVWKPDWHILQANPPTDKKGPNQITDHALNYAGFAETTFETINTQLDNQNRKWNNLLLYTMLRSAFYYSIVVPFRYVMVPLYRLISSHKIHLLLTFVLATLLNTNPALLTFLNRKRSAPLS